jgi:hypothetical protein
MSCASSDAETEEAGKSELEEIWQKLGDWSDSEDEGKKSSWRVNSGSVLM